MFTDYVESVQNKTFKRWADCLAEIKLVEAELIKADKESEQVKPVATKLNVELTTKELTLKQIEALLGFKVKLIA